ncbi:MAG: ATP-binding cassette domain-containing protein, partial [Frisingicoccus sp.]
HRKHNISLVFQNYNLIDYLTTVENVKLGGSGNAEKLLEEVGIGKEYWQRNVLQLSGGQQQRVAIARALASDAHVLLADEPTGNLTKLPLMKSLLCWKKTAHELGKCVVAVMHSKHLAEEADEILEIKNGAISFVARINNSAVEELSLWNILDIPRRNQF